MLHLQRLTLSNCRLTNECVFALAGAELPALCDVDFRYCVARHWQCESIRVFKRNSQ
jgi:hypothetical protein